MIKQQDGSGAKYREIAVLSIIPCIVGVLIITSWAFARWKIGPYYLNAGMALFATLFGGYLRFVAEFKDIFSRKITVNVFVTVALIATIAIGASVACNCHPCVEFHTSKANEMNIEPELIKQAVEVGKMVRKGAATQMDELIEDISKEF